MSQAGGEMQGWREKERGSWEEWQIQGKEGEGGGEADRCRCTERLVVSVPVMTYWTRLHSLNQSAAAAGIMCPIDAAIFSPHVSQPRITKTVAVTFLSHISVAPVSFLPHLVLTLCYVTQEIHQIQRTAEWETGTKKKADGNKEKKCTFKATRQRGKVLDRVNFVNPLRRDFLRLHGLHLAEASLSPLICHVIGHWALSDHVLETSCLVTTDWDLLYHWHRRLSLSRLLLHHLRVERLCVLHFVYEAVSWVRFPVLAHSWNTEHLPVLLPNWRTCLIYFTYLSARLRHLSSGSLLCIYFISLNWINMI